MNKKLIWGIIGIIAIASAIIGAYLFIVKYKPCGQNCGPISQLETKDWKVYTNEEYGFEFKYPSDWIINGDRLSEECGCFFLDLDRQNREVNSVKAPLLGLRIYYGQEDLDSFLTSHNPKGEQKSIKISGVSAVRTSFIGQNGKSGIFVGFVKSKNGFTFSSFDSEGDETVVLANQILSTFKFTEQNFTDEDTKDWKVYTNEEYGFELKYPLDWYVDDYLTLKTCCMNITNFDGGTEKVLAGQMGIQIAKYTKPVSQSLVDFASLTSVLTTTPPTVETVTIGSLQGVRSNQIGDGLYYLPRSEIEGIKMMVWSRIDSKVALEMFTQKILSTFKFTSPGTASYSCESGTHWSETVKGCVLNQAIIPVSNSDWKTYSNSEKGISIQYPPTWTVEVQSDLNRRWYVRLINPDQKALAEQGYINIYDGCTIIHNYEWQIELAGVYDKLVCVNKFQIELTAFNDQSRAIEDQILSTFKFTK